MNINDKERAEFEKWFLTHYEKASRAYLVMQIDGKRYADELAYAAFLAWQAGKTKAEQSAWISVEERQSEPHQLVLMSVTNGEKNLIDIRYCRKGKGLDRVENLFCNGFKPTYWQPLPEPIQNNADGA